MAAVVDYTLEYVSGGFWCINDTSGDVNVVNVFMPMAINVGSSQENVRVYVMREGAVIWDNGGYPLQPHEMPSNIGVFAPAPETGGGLCWARIYTTSPSVVVSAWVTNEVPIPPMTTFYFSPGDFKVFDVRHFHPPPGPVGPPVAE